jgi:hypothetical protein
MNPLPPALQLSLSSARPTSVPPARSGGGGSKLSSFLCTTGKEQQWWLEALPSNYLLLLRRQRGAAATRDSAPEVTLSLPLTSLLSKTTWQLSKSLYSRCIDASEPGSRATRSVSQVACADQLGDYTTLYRNCTATQNHGCLCIRKKGKKYA